MLWEYLFDLQEAHFMNFEFIYFDELIIIIIIFILFKIIFHVDKDKCSCGST
jgi:hypothetical protein